MTKKCQSGKRRSPKTGRCISKQQRRKSSKKKSKRSKSSKKKSSKSKRKSVRRKSVKKSRKSRKSHSDKSHSVKSHSVKSHSVKSHSVKSHSVKDFGMFTSEGNKRIQKIVNKARKIDGTFAEKYKFAMLLKRGLPSKFGEAGDTYVNEQIHHALK